MSKAKQLRGKDFMVFVGGKATALATSHKLDLNAETSNTASKDDGLWDNSMITKMSWTASTDAMTSQDPEVDSYDTMFDKFIAGEPVAIICGIPSNLSAEGVPEGGWQAPATKYYQGTALITALSRSDSAGDNSTFTVSFKGVGKLSKVTGMA